MKYVKAILFTFFTLLVSVSPASWGQNSIFDTSSSSLFSNDNEFLKVDQAFIFDAYQRGDTVDVSFNVQEGYYLYRHQFKFSVENAEIAEVNLPQGIEHEDEFFGVQQIFDSGLNFPIQILSAGDNATLTIRYQGCAKKGLCYPPTKKVVQLDAVDSNSTAVLSALSNQSEQPNNAQQTQSSQTSSTGSVSEQFELADMLQNESLLITLLAFFTGGLLLSFTPCVFPMYPILSGIIVGQGDNLSTKKAFSLSFFYVQGMAITYTVLGVVVALAGAQFQAMFQHPAVLIGLSILFIFLALSMFGLFNLALPASLQSKLNNLSNQQEGGSYTGVLSMGAISGLVASPCTTAPLTGALIYISQTGDIVLGASALYALSLGMGLPLLVLGSSGGKILPRAGAWMNVIKNIFGLLLLAVPIFLLERFIPAQASTALWALLIMASATYFYVANQTDNKNFWYGLRLGIIFFAFFIGANKMHQLVSPTAATHQGEVAAKAHPEFVKVATLAELEQTVAKANAQGQTVMVDLYADWCVACKEFEEYTFPEPVVVDALANSLWVQVDLTDTTSDESIELMGHYEVFGLPSILFFDTSGTELSNKRVTGFMGAEDFANHVNSTFK